MLIVYLKEAFRLFSSLFGYLVASDLKNLEILNKTRSRMNVVAFCALFYYYRLAFGYQCISLSYLLRNVINKFETKHRNWLQLCLPLASGDLPKAVKGRHIIIIVAGAAE